MPGIGSLIREIDDEFSETWENLKYRLDKNCFPQDSCDAIYTYGLEFVQIGL